MTFFLSLSLKRIHTFSNPCLLHRRLLCTFNSGGGGGEFNSAIKKPSPSPSNQTSSTFSLPASFNEQNVSFNSPDGQTPLGTSLITFMRNQWGDQLQEKLKQITLMRNHRGEQLRKKWKQYKANLRRLNARYSNPDYKLISKFIETRKAFHNEIVQSASEFPNSVAGKDWLSSWWTKYTLRNKVNELITWTKDLDKTSQEGVKLVAELSNSRVAYYDEMMKDLSEIRKEWTLLKDLNSLHEDLRNVRLNKEEELGSEEELNEDLWNELNKKLGDIKWDELHEVLVGCREVYSLIAKQLAMVTDEHVICLKENLKLLHEIREPFN